MSKQIGIAIGVILLLAVGGVGYMQISSKAKTQTPTGNDTTNSADSGSTMESLKDLLAAGKSVSCTVNYTGDQVGTSGTTYVSGKKMRADFMMKDSSGKEIVSHMIQDGTYAYIWSADGTMGTKMKVDVAQEAGTDTANTQTQSQSAVDLNQKMNMRCSGWSVDESMFTPPATVKFTDLSEAMKNLPKASDY